MIGMGACLSDSEDMQPHAKARSEDNVAYAGKRQVVPDALVPWTVPWPEYAPVEWTHAVVIGDPVTKKAAAPWADNADATQVDFSKRSSFERALVFNSKGRPINPCGRTGTSGRGLLGKWGANHAADPMVIRLKPGKERRKDGSRLCQMVAIKRSDGGKLAIPGGMVDEGEHVSQTLRREFTEETSDIADPVLKQQTEAKLDEVFRGGGELVYEGYVDDPRNTDNAWMETTARLFAIDESLSAQLTLQGGSDALLAMWVDLDEELLAEGSEVLYADHRRFIIKALGVALRKLAV